MMNIFHHVNHGNTQNHMVMCRSLINNYSSSPNGLWVNEGERNNCFSKIQLVGQKDIETKNLSQAKARHQPFFTAKT